jgi:hypothetical protein
MSDTDQRLRLLHNEQLNPTKKERWLRCSLFRSLPFWPPRVKFFTGWVTNCIPAHRLSLFRPLLPVAALDRVEESLDYSAVFL